MGQSEVIILLLSLNAFSLSGGTRQEKELEAMEQKISFQVNEYRKGKGLPELVSHEAIRIESKRHSENMSVGLVGVGHRGFRERVARIGKRLRYREAAENVGLNQGYPDPARTVFDGWLESEEHRQNIEGDFDLTGIGVAKDRSNTYYFTQIFIRTVNGPVSRPR